MLWVYYFCLTWPLLNEFLAILNVSKGWVFYPYDHSSMCLSWSNLNIFSSENFCMQKYVRFGCFRLNFLGIGFFNHLQVLRKTNFVLLKSGVILRIKIGPQKFSTSRDLIIFSIQVVIVFPIYNCSSINYPK